MIVVIYTIIILFATILGPIIGLGGGVIIRPLLDLVGEHEVAAIAFYSSLAVLTMAIVSIVKQLMKGFKFKWKIIITISLGSLIGGLIGQEILSIITSDMDNNVVVILQSSILIAMLLLVLLYKFNKHKIKHYKIKNLFVILVVGIILGTIAVFLGIGGGPINMLVFLFLFSFPVKQATVYSIATIFFAQLSNIFLVVVTSRASNFDLSFVPLIIITSIVGGLIGTKINLLFNDSKIDKCFNIVMIVLIMVSIFNIINSI